MSLSLCLRRLSNCRVLRRTRRLTAFRVYDHSRFNTICNLLYSLLAHRCIKSRYFTYSQRSITSIKLKCAKYSLETNQPYRFDAIFPAPFAVFQRLGPARRLYIVRSYRTYNWWFTTTRLVPPLYIAHTTKFAICNRIYNTIYNMYENTGLG